MVCFFFKEKPNYPPIGVGVSVRDVQEFYSKGHRSHFVVCDLRMPRPHLIKGAVFGLMLIIEGNTYEKIYFDFNMFNDFIFECLCRMS